ncbi:MAG: response regulator [Proteobacteria bacterium]|nr:response regulator [Pseudomonadota bacterium]
MNTPLRLLLVEDSDDDARLILDAIRSGGYEPRYERVETAVELGEALYRQPWEVILSDYRLPSFNGLAALKLVRGLGKDTPFIIVSGTIGEELAVEMMLAGADDYVMKNNLARLGPAIRRELREAEDRRLRREAEAVLRESQQLLEKAQHIGQIGSWVSDPDLTGRLIWSAQTARIFGFAPGEFDGRVESFFALLHPDDRACVAQAAQAAFIAGLPYNLEHRIVRRDGQVRWVHEQADVERDPAGRPLRMVGVVQDITDRKHLEEQLRQAQKMEAIGQLAGGIAHDFNNLLTAIMCNVELVRSMAPDDPVLPDCHAAILVATERARDLVRQILAFSRRQEHQRQPMQLHVVIKEALKLLRATVPAAVEFRASIPLTPTVLANPSEIHQVTLNLCTNAWHALQGRAGTIRVELAETEVSPDFARLHPDLRPGPYVSLTVADNGCGMDTATLQHIFEPFFTTKPLGEGTGLGLAVVHGIVKTHDGGIVVESQPGQGTSFSLYFPVFEAEAMADPAQPAPLRTGKDERVLFVDDEEPLAKLGQVLLSRLGYRATTLTSPVEALALFERDPRQFDLVITDLNMPGLSGLELARKLFELRPGLPIILTTGFSATLTLESLREQGIRELLHKPYDLRGITEALRRLLGEVADPGR